MLYTLSYVGQNFGVFLLGSAKRRKSRLIRYDIIFDSNLCDHNTSTSQTDGQTDDLSWQCRAPGADLTGGHLCSGRLGPRHNVSLLGRGGLNKQGGCENCRTHSATPSPFPFLLHVNSHPVCTVTAHINICLIITDTTLHGADY